MFSYFLFSYKTLLAKQIYLFETKIKILLKKYLNFILSETKELFGRFVYQQHPHYLRLRVCKYFILVYMILNGILKFFMLSFLLKFYFQQQNCCQPTFQTYRYLYKLI